MLKILQTTKGIYSKYYEHFKKFRASVRTKKEIKLSILAPLKVLWAKYNKAHEIHFMSQKIGICRSSTWDI